MAGFSAKQRREQVKRERLAEIEKLIASGQLVIRQMTAEERKRNPAKRPAQGFRERRY